MLVLLFVALWFILRGDLLYVFPCVILFLCFSVLLVLRLPRLGKRELILVLSIHLFDLCLFGFVGFLFLLGSGKAAVCDCGTPWTFVLPFFFLYEPGHSIFLQDCMCTQQRFRSVCTSLFLMSTHFICCHGEVRQILCGYPLLSGAMSISSVSALSLGGTKHHKPPQTNHKQHHKPP